MAKDIKIHLGTYFDARGVQAANRSLASIAAGVKNANAEIAQATLKAEAAVNSYQASADKAALAMGGGYKTLAQQLAELKSGHNKVATAATAAGKAATEGALSAETAMAAANGGMEGITKFLAGIIPGFKSMGAAGVAAFGAIVGAGASLFQFAKALGDLFATVFNWDSLDKSIRGTINGLSSLEHEAKLFNEEMAESRKHSQEMSKHLAEELDSMKKLVDAQIELNRQKDLSLAKTEEERSAVEARYSGLQGEAEEAYKYEQLNQRGNDLNSEELRINEELRNAKRLKAEYEKTNRRLSAALPEAADDATGVGEFFGGIVPAIFGRESSSRRKFDSIFAGSVRARNNAIEQGEIIEAKEKELEEIARKRELLYDDYEALEMESEAKNIERERAAVEEREKLQDEAAKRDEESRKKVIAETAAAEKEAIAERVRLEAEAHKSAMENLKKEKDALAASGTSASARITRAETEFDKAFAMYRDKEAGAKAIAEERDYAADLEQLHKDAARYGGKWRISELSNLIASGDTAGYQSTLEKWRKSSSFSPEVEAMVRASAAEKTKTTAEDELRKIENNTADLAKKLDELLQVKG